MTITGKRTTDMSHMHEHLRIGTHTTASAGLHLDDTFNDTSVN